MKNFTPNYTKGPWSVGPLPATYAGIPIENRFTPEQIAIIKKPFNAMSVGTKAGQTAIVPLDESNIYNATLIAAAPELVALILPAVKLYEALSTEDENAPVDFEPGELKYMAGKIRTLLSTLGTLKI